MPIDFGILRIKLHLPDDIQIRECPKEVDIRTGAGLLPDEILFSLHQLNIVKFPLHPFFNYIFNKLRLSPLQMNPNFLRVISVLLLLSRDRGLDLDIIDLLLCYKVNIIRLNNLYYHFYPLEKRSICIDKLDSEKRWKKNIVGVRGAWSTPAAQDYPIPTAFHECSVSSYQKYKNHKADCPCEICVPRFCIFLCRSLGIPSNDLSYGVCRDRVNYLKKYVLNNVPSYSDLLTSDNLTALSTLGSTVSSRFYPSVGGRIL